jgi:hypothetical protein
MLIGCLTHPLNAVGVPVLQAQAMVDSLLPVPAAVALAVFEKRQELNKRLQASALSQTILCFSRLVPSLQRPCVLTLVVQRRLNSTSFSAWCNY